MGLFGSGCLWPEKFLGQYGHISAATAAEAIIDFIITDGWTKPADWAALAEISPELAPVEVESSPLTLA
jgi:hypothetical protein